MIQSSPKAPSQISSRSPLSGSPKLRACEIISAFGNNKRGTYGGRIGCLSFSEDMDMHTAIRIIFQKDGRVYIHSGNGIVAENVSKKEYAECRNNRADREALEKSEEDDPA